jgi:FixJ family two-component response regulator
MDQRVLVIEDEPSLRRALCSLLDSLNIETVAFSNAEEAWSQQVRWIGRCTGALVDVTLPGASGLDFSHQLRAKRPEMPIVLTSGLRGVWSLDALEPVCYMAKPYGLAELQQAVLWIFPQEEEESLSGEDERPLGKVEAI